MWYIVYGMRVLAILPNEYDAKRMLTYMHSNPSDWSIQKDHIKKLEVMYLTVKTTAFLGDLMEDVA
jgi:hypothetical protein